MCFRIFFIIWAIECLLLGIDGALLRLGNPLSWFASKPYLDRVRQGGVDQFIKHYNRCKNVETPAFLWGDELEYGVFNYDSFNKRYDISRNGTELRNHLTMQEKERVNASLGCEWQPEYGAWMIEAVPRNPFGSSFAELLDVEKSMQLRRKQLHSALSVNEIAPSVSLFPMLGTSEVSNPQSKLSSSIAISTTDIAVSNSKYLSDDIINPHPRFAALTRNIRKRRGSNVDIRVKKDVTGKVGGDSSERSDTSKCSIACGGANKQPDEIHMDAMAFGMGCCCLQITMQCKSEQESRYLHDQLAIVAPWLHALSAATPIFKGQLVATDTRWDVIAQSVDDRTPAERGEQRPPSLSTTDANNEINNKIAHSSFHQNDLETLTYLQAQEQTQSHSGTTEECGGDKDMAGDGIRRINKSRYGTVSTFLGQPQSVAEAQAMDSLNNVNVPFDETIYAKLLTSGVDKVLAKHIAHLFIRDPLVIFDDAIDLDHNDSLDHFENIQSTNWRTMRWKLPSLRVGQEYNRRRLLLQQQKQQEQNQEPLGSGSQNRMPTLLECLRCGSNRDCRDNFLWEECRRLYRDHRYFATDQNSVQTNDYSIHSKNVNEMSQKAQGLQQKVQKGLNNDNDDIQSYGPGWRVEFRPLEIQLTDFENSAYAIFIVLLSRYLLANSREFNLYMPMSFVEENMRRAVKKNAVHTQKFWVRRNAFDGGNVKHTSSNRIASTGQNARVCEDSVRDDAVVCGTDQLSSLQFHIPNASEIDMAELTLDEIINGEKLKPSVDTISARSGCNTDVSSHGELSGDEHVKATRFPGLVPIIKQHIQTMSTAEGDPNTDTIDKLLSYLDLISQRASGSLPTTAAYIREFVTSHPTYKQDGKITHAINNDLLRHCEDVGMGRVHAPKLYGDRVTVPPLDKLSEEQLMLGIFKTD